MGEVTNELEDAIAILQLDESIISKIDRPHNEVLYYEILAHFVKGGDRRWWWEAFRDSFSFNIFDYPPNHLKSIIPNLERKVWLMIEDDQDKFYPIYDVNPNYIPEILNNCFHFEYYIIDKDLDWLICENHHRRVVGVGDELRKHNLSLIN